MDFYAFFAVFVVVGSLVAAHRWGKGAVELSLLLLFLGTQPAMAAPLTARIISPDSDYVIAALGTSDSAINQGQQALEEDLKLDPTGDHYKGIEYSEQSVKNQPADQDLMGSIESQLPEDVIVAVSNGSVRRSGSVKNRAA
ncbi:MAG: hypothetical protein WBA76_22185, partial [Phormidesmis sp.]